MTRRAWAAALGIVALVVAFLVGATIQANWPDPEED